MKELEVKCEDKILGKIVGYEENEDGLTMSIQPTDEFYKMQKDFEKAISKVKVRTIRRKNGYTT